MRARQRMRAAQVVQRQRAAMPGVLERQQAGAGEVRIHRLDGGGDAVQRQRAIRGLDDRLRLDRPQHRRAAALVLVGMRFHADQVFVAAFAMRQQGQQVGLGAGGHEQPGVEPQLRGQPLLQCVDGGVLAVDVVADPRLEHRRAHRAGGLGHRVAAQVDHVHGSLQGTAAGVRGHCRRCGLPACIDIVARGALNRRGRGVKWRHLRLREDCHDEHPAALPAMRLRLRLRGRRDAGLPGVRT